ncbi:MAG: hypothetical protein ACK5P7_07665 [Bdellovibrio sp.]|jgi:hypothetical protein
MNRNRPWLALVLFILVSLNAGFAGADSLCPTRADGTTELQQAGVAACVNMCQQVSNRQDEKMTHYFSGKCAEEAERQSRRGLSGAGKTGVEVLDDALLQCLPLAVKKSVVGTIELVKGLPQLMSLAGEKLAEAAARNQLPEGFNFQDCEQSADCKRALARQLINYQTKNSQGQWAVSDAEVDKQTQAMRVTDMLAMIPEHRRKSRDKCASDLAATRRRVNSGSEDWTTAMHRRVYDTLGTEHPHCLGILKLYPPELRPPLLNPASARPTPTPPPLAANDPLDQLSTAQLIEFGRTCMGREMIVEFCAEIVSVLVPLPVGEAAAVVARSGIFSRPAAKIRGTRAEAPGATAGTSDFARARENRAPMPADLPTRSQFIARHEMVQITNEQQNLAWMNLAKLTKSDGRTLFVDIENSKMKYLNDSLRDKSLVTAITNRHKQIVLEKMDKLKAEFPNLEILPYSDFKALRFAFREPVPPRLKDRLGKVFTDANQEFRDELVKSRLVRNEDLAENWFRAGVGRTADQANIASRYSRNVDGPNLVRDYADPALHGNLGQNLISVEYSRDQVQTGLMGTGLLEAVPGSTNRMIPKLDVMDVVRKEKTPEAIRDALNQRYGQNLTLKQSAHLRDYLNRVDEFSPGIHVAKREVPTLTDATAGGLSADFAGMGSHNMRETARALANSRNLDEALVATRNGERTVTQLFQQRMRDRQAIIRNYLEDKKNMPGLKITCSGDDCIATVPRAMTTPERNELVQRLSRTDEPAGMRLAFVKDGISNPGERNILAAHGEGIEKQLRRELAGKITEDKMKNVLFAVEMNGTARGEGAVRLMTGNSRTALSAIERRQIQEAFLRAVQVFNRTGNGANMPPARYIAQP